MESHTLLQANSISHLIIISGTPELYVPFSKFSDDFYIYQLPLVLNQDGINRRHTPLGEGLSLLPKTDALPALHLDISRISLPT